MPGGCRLGLTGARMVLRCSGVGGAEGGSTMKGDRFRPHLCDLIRGVCGKEGGAVRHAIVERRQCSQNIPHTAGAQWRRRG